MSRRAEDREWVSLRAAARLLEVSTGTFVRLATDGHIRIQDLPGLAPRYSRSDVLKLASASVRPTGNPTPAA
jgi:hypothetical protein